MAVLLGSLVAALPASAQTADFDRLAGYLDGRFDNRLQVWREGEDGVPDSLRHRHLHLVLAPADRPDLGARAVHVRASDGAGGAVGWWLLALSGEGGSSRSPPGTRRMGRPSVPPIAG